MARRRKTATAIRTIRVPRAAGPQIIKVQAPRAAPVKRKTHRRRRRSSSIAGFGGAAARSNVDVAIGGGLYGLLVKSGMIDKLPAIPIVGRTGTAAILLTYASQRGMGGEMVKRMAIAASVLAGYQLGSTGVITGDAPMNTMGGFQTMGAGQRYMIEEVDGDDGDDVGDDDSMDGDDMDDGEPVDD